MPARFASIAHANPVGPAPTHIKSYVVILVRFPRLSPGYANQPMQNGASRILPGLQLQLLVATINDVTDLSAEGAAQFRLPPVRGTVPSIRRPLLRNLPLKTYNLRLSRILTNSSRNFSNSR